MNKTCDIVQDLMPLYLDGICSDASRQMVTEHLKSCPSCSRMWQQLHNSEIETQLRAETAGVVQRQAAFFKRRSAFAGAIVAGILMIPVVICLIVIVLSLNLLVKTLIIRRQKEIGIKKALGFSSRQLRTELILSMLPQIGVGALVGSILGGLWSNPILSSLLTSLGIMKSGMEVFAWMVALSVGFALVASFVIIWIISRRIKRISAYTLITE
jgi:ABC-type antimicrobial peptide transport system permease subunit